MPDALPFTHEMVIVHKAFRREFGDGPAWVRRVAPGDTAQATLVYQHLGKTFDTLHHHRQLAATHVDHVDDLAGDPRCPA